MQSGSMTMSTSSILRQHTRSALRKALETAGFLVFDGTAEGRERERLGEFWATLMLLGLPMPRMGGLEVFRRLRDDDVDTPDALIVTHGRIPEVTAAVRLGVVDVLARPLTPEAVRAAVEEILRPAVGSPPDPARPRILVTVERLVLELLRAKRSLDRREFADAERRLCRVIDLDPDSAVAHNLMGVLHQSLGEHHASYHAFRTALRADPHYEPRGKT